MNAASTAPRKTSHWLVTAVAAALSAASVVAPHTVSAANPFVTTIYTADPSAHVWADGRLYVYPSRDVDPPKGCDLMDKYHVFSTDDMVHWRDEGQILEADQVKWGRPEGGFMWAPDAAYKNGTYYFYFPHPSGTRWNDTWKIGVATSKKPASDFTPLPEPIKGIDGFAMIDPAVFVDTDGRAYLYFGGGGKCQGGKLKDDMVELDGALAPMTGLEDFHEATWVFKRGDLYYLTYADNHVEGQGKDRRGANRLHYATSTNPLGPWTHRGVYLDPTGCDTSHGSVVEYKGQWYAFYHNQSISGRGNLRSICVDKLNFNPDGTIQKVVQTKEGPAPVGPTRAPGPKAVTYAPGVAAVTGGATLDDDAAAPSGKCVRNFHRPTAACEFDNVDGGPGGRATLSIVYATPEPAKLRLTANGTDYSFLNTPPTGAWDAYKGLATFTLPLKPGKTNKITLTGGNGGVNIETITLTPIAGG